VIIDVQRAGPSTGMPTRTQQCDIIACAYASHGDTKHVLLFPEDPAEAFEFAAQAFRSRRPAADHDLRHARSRHRHEPSAVPPAEMGRQPQYDRGKVMTRSARRRRDFGRYLDVDGDGIPYRTYPGTHPTKGSFFTRGTSRDRYARYTEEGAVLCRQHAAAGAQVRDRQGHGAAAAAGQRRQADQIRRDLFRLDRAGDGRGDRLLGSARPSARPAADPRLPVPFQRASFIADHDFVYVVEQNRDAQLRSLIVNENGIDPVRLVPILHYDGTPITARFIAGAIGDHQDQLKVTPLRKVKS
jgi:2-oxoglutarate ferredoxin oxidoreductase subunit alpha